MKLKERTNGKRQVCNLFQEPVEQPLLCFRIAEKKPDRLIITKILTKSGTESYLRENILEKERTTLRSDNLAGKRKKSDIL